MDKHTRQETLEDKIIRTARSLFVQKGFVETSMSDIAAAAGINRPTLHYYFRTKDKMFRAVFRDIVEAIIPAMQDIVSQQDRPVRERVTQVVDAYFKTFTANPSLPLFVIKEMQRDISLLLNTIRELHQEARIENIILSLQREMEQGRLKTVPLPFVFYTLYSLLTMPFLSQPLAKAAFLHEGETFDDLIRQWKPYIVMHMVNLLDPQAGAATQP